MLDPISLSPPGHAHFVGIGGAGMRALAEYLSDYGWRLSGSDLDVNTPGARALAARGVAVSTGHRREHVAEGTNLVIHSAAVPADNPERIEARERGLPDLSYVDVLGILCRQRETIGIAGTHGKSTTTALCSWILESAGADPGYLCGAELAKVQRGGRAGSGRHLVVECCEFRRHFLEVPVRSAAILSVEPDHFDCYATLDETVDAFASFAGNLPADGLLLWNAECANTARAVAGATCRCVSFAIDGPADWRAARVRANGPGIEFDVVHHGTTVTHVRLPLPGRHNAMNALTAAALCLKHGIDPEAVAEGLASFPGLRRRFELMGHWRGAVLVDDYAHHPTEIRAALQAARDAFPGGRLRCVFQPHQRQRTEMLMEEFAVALASADQVFVVPVFSARESDDQANVTLSRELVSLTGVRGGRSEFGTSLDRIAATLETDVREGDVLITLGAGDIYRLHDRFDRRIL
ncbi:UDP-N-acetylmuramate--L-alanine ligase MurC [Maioricimonas rarisocia]|uniref:UDP-N-acetylmuramate--L-alanine ligase n=1 Tax=Maioricimonas rarisocia TaxID=2528026 RepID=A0A517ZBB8_9PLAN|nr:UDP-N-acetylmuramate--L-alanine ligase [Maioricimonas rarisocia]QDU39729.1 UDP-N-acetylmuramate--L-alanine ligase MurC [Maioricimonas rarisocia]